VESYDALDGKYPTEVSGYKVTTNDGPHGETNSVQQEQGRLLYVVRVQRPRIRQNSPDNLKVMSKSGNMYQEGLWRTVNRPAAPTPAIPLPAKTIDMLTAPVLRALPTKKKSKDIWIPKCRP